ncbi:MAG: sulfurtransferase TusA family protein [Geminicoccaceae bacterium]
MVEERQHYDALIDARGLVCPMPLVKARQALQVLGSGAKVCVLATDPAAERDFEDFADATGHTLDDVTKAEGVLRLVLRKR